MEQPAFFPHSGTCLYSSLTKRNIENRHKEVKPSDERAKFAATVNEKKRKVNHDK
jgi:hypothetical protein